jgi:hypothetical protein
MADLRIQTQAAHGLSAGEIIDIWGCESMPQLNGQWEVANPVPSVTEIDLVVPGESGIYDASGWDERWIRQGYVIETVTRVYGMDHLFGLEVDVVANGSPHPAQTVTRGAATPYEAPYIDLDYPASKITVGIPYKTQILLLDVDFADGPLHGMKRRISAGVVELYKSQPFKMGNSEATATPVKLPPELTTFGQPPQLFTGVVRHEVLGGTERTGGLYIEQDQPVPLNLLAIFTEVERGGN